MKTWHRLKRWVTWKQDVPYDEQASCELVLAQRPQEGESCSRAKGAFIVAAIPVRNVERSPCDPLLYCNGG